MSLLLVTLVLSSCSNEDESELVSGDKFELKSFSDQKYTVYKEANDYQLVGYENKIVIYDIFATWCPPCRASATHLTSLEKKYKDNLKVIALTIEKKLSLDDLNAFRDKYNAKYFISTSGDNQDLVRMLTSSIKAGADFGIPLQIMYKNGKYVTHYVGAIPEEMLESDILKAIGK